MPRSLRGAWPEDGVRIFHYVTYTSRARVKKKGRRISIGWICEDLGLQWRQLDTNPGSKTFPHRSAESSRKYSIGLANHHLSIHSHSRRPWWPPSPWGRPVVSRRIFEGTRNDPPLQWGAANPPVPRERGSFGIPGYSLVLVRHLGLQHLLRLTHISQALLTMESPLVERVRINGQHPQHK